MYITCRGIIDKQIYIDSFTNEKYMDPVVREMMQKVRTIPSTTPGPTVWTIRKKSGEERSFNAKPGAPLSHDNNVKRYNRMADFMEIDRAQADRAREQWMNLSDCEGHRSSHADHCEIWQAQALVRQKPRPLGLTDKNSTQTMFF